MTRLSAACSVLLCGALVALAVRSVESPDQPTVHEAQQEPEAHSGRECRRCLRQAVWPGTGRATGALPQERAQRRLLDKEQQGPQASTSL